MGFSIPLKIDILIIMTGPFSEQPAYLSGTSSFIRLSLCLSICLPVYLPICLPIYQPIRSNYLSRHHLCQDALYSHYAISTSVFLVICLQLHQDGGASTHTYTLYPLTMFKGKKNEATLTDLSQPRLISKDFSSIRIHRHTHTHTHTCTYSRA